MAYFILFVFGLVLGSFFNVVSLRYKPGQKLFGKKVISGRSKCLHCHKKLAWYELIPLFSFIWQRGRCRVCRRKLLLQYPLVEFLSGLIFAGIPYYLINFQFSSTLRLGYRLSIGTIFNSQLINQLSAYQLIIIAIWILIFLLFLLLSIIDFRQSVIPDEINLLLVFLGLILLGLTVNYHKFDPVSSPSLGSYAIIFGLRDNIFINYFFAVLLGAAIFGAIIVLSRGRGMGWGDLKLIAGMGLIFGWPEIILILALSFISGAVFSIPLLTSGRKDIKDAVPFGPFLVTGATLTFFFGYQIMRFYFQLVSL